MIYGKFILRIEYTDAIHLFNNEKELIENANLMLPEFEIIETASNIEELKSIINTKCEGLHLYSKIAG